MDTELVLDVAHVHTAITLVVDKHRQAASVACAFFGAGQHQVDVGVAVSDEALHTVEAPCAVGILCSLEHDTLQVRTGVGLGEVHGHGLALADTWDVLSLLLRSTKLIERVDAALQAPHVLEAGVCGRHHLREHGEDRDGQVQTTEAARHGDAPQASLAGSVKVFVSLAGIDHAVVFEVWSFLVHAFRVGLDDGLCHVVGDGQDALIVLDGIVVVDGSILELVFVGEVSFFQLNDSLHERIVEVIF